MKFKHFLLFLFGSLTCTTVFSKEDTGVARPKLVVGIVIDQMRWDYLYRYYDLYGNGGFKRLMNEGFNCQNTLINYLPSFTGPGHSCIYTGSVPAFHGIVANDWIDNRTGRSWYCAEDTTVASIGGGKAGLMSPNNLLATTITDELRLATNFQSRTFGISIKDRGAILPAGHTANAAYWYDDSNKSFITSSFYMKELPEWVKTFNAAKWGDKLMANDWTLLYDAQKYTQSTADNTNYEGLFAGETAPVFPHKTSQWIADGDAIRSTPYGNTLTRMMAEACIDAEHLGQMGYTDFLAVSFSSTDYVGHKFGPNAMEVEDTYLRLDQDLAHLLNDLDIKLGKGNYTVFLSADHGAAHNTAFSNDHKIPANAWPASVELKRLNDFLKAETGADNIITSLMNYQVYLNEAAIKNNNLNRDVVREKIMHWFSIQDGITQVIDLENSNQSAVPEPVKTMVVNGYYSNRCGSIQIILDPASYSGHSGGPSGKGNTGTTHGSWNPYDTHIPLLWFGWGIQKGETFRTTHMTDIAATLAALLHIQTPNACIGEAIPEVKKN